MGFELIDFDKFALSHMEKKTLKRMADEELPSEGADFQHLLEIGLVKRPSNGFDISGAEIAGEGYVLSDNGRLYLVYLQGQRATSRTEWIKWGVTTAIALGAMTIALVALVRTF